jgi:hypothetical protein
MKQKLEFGLLVLLISFNVNAQSKIVLAEVMYYKNTYHLSVDDNVALTDLLSKKHAALQQLNKTDSNSVQYLKQWNYQLSFNKQIHDIINKGDAYRYFNEQVKLLATIKPLHDSDYKKLNDRYNELFKRTSSFSNKDRFDAALKWTLSDTAYYSKLFQTQINDLAIPITISENNRLQQYKPSPDFWETMRPVIRKKTYQTALLTFTYYRDYVLRDSLVKIVTAKYDSMIMAQLIKDGVFINSGIMNAAVKFRKLLKLRQTQTDSIIDKGMQLNKLKDSVWQLNPLAAFDSKDYENKWLSTILEEEQFITLLSNKYLPVAKQEAENTWADIEKRGLAKGLKKEDAINEMIMYYVKVKASSSMYAYDVDKQAAYARSAREAMPNAVKLIQYARKNNITNTDPTKQLEIKW